MTVLSNKASQIEDEDDPMDRMLKKTGCIEYHYQVQDCMVETQDWRKCQEPLQIFKKCMEKYQKKQEETYKSKKL